MRRGFVVVGLSLSFFLLTACSTQESQKIDKKEPKKEAVEASKKQGETETDWFEKFRSAPEAAKTPIEFVNQEPGPYAHADLKSGVEGYEKLFESFGNVPEDATNEQLDKVFNFALSQVAADIPDPQDLIETWKVGSFGNPELEDTRYHFKENYNIEVILDSSGSMKHVINGKSRMDIAKDAIQSFLKEAPSQAKVALRVYGHKGTGSDKDKKMSCASSELVYNFNSYNDGDFSKALNSFQPAGWTPLAISLQDAQEDLKQYDGATNTNMIYVVSDGIETCDGDPVATAKELADSNLKPVINIIGFDVDAKGQKQLKEMAHASSGTYTHVGNADQLKEEFNRAKGALEKWKSWKIKADSSANEDRVTRSLETFDYDTKYLSLINHQNINLSVLLRVLYDRNQITLEQWRYLEKKSSKVYHSANDARDSIYEDLQNLNAKTLEETKKQIQEKYDQNTK